MLCRVLSVGLFVYYHFFGSLAYSRASCLRVSSLYAKLELAKQFFSSLFEALTGDWHRSTANYSV